MTTDLDDESDVPVLEYGQDILVVDDNDPNLIAIEEIGRASCRERV